MKYANEIYDILIKALFNGYKVAVILMIVIFVQLTNEFNYFYVTYISLFIFFSMSLIMKTKKFKGISYFYESKILVFYMAINSVISSLLVFYRTNTALIIIGTVLFFIVNIYAYKTTYSVVKRKMEIVLIILFVIVIYSYFVTAANNLSDTDKYLKGFFTAVNNDIIIYFLLFVLFLNNSNMNLYFSKSNAINRSYKQIALKSVITVFLITIVVFKNKIISLVGFWFSKIENVFVAIYNVINTVIFNSISSFFNWLAKDYVENPDKYENLEGTSKNLEELQNSNVNEAMIEFSEAPIFDFSILFYFISFVVLIIIVIIIIKEIKPNRRKINDLEYEHIEVKVKKEGIISKIIENLTTNKIRKKYKSTVKDYIKKGFVFENYYTPNDYLKKVSCEDFDGRFSCLTEEYNKVRYGSREGDKNEEKV